MTAETRSLLAEQTDLAAHRGLTLERILALAEVMDTSSSAPVRTAAASIRTIILNGVGSQR